MSGSSGIWNYTYDDEGLRTTRTNGTKTYTYVYSGGLLRKMTVAGNTLIIRYGADGRPYSVHFGNAEYFYLLNAQGDVIGLVNYEGTQVVAYTYDAWGNILSTTGTMASTLGQYNPLRYRSYVYDQETGRYYLQSRYYNPEWGRFINADSQLVTRDIIGLNLFAYCGNNPVNYIDVNGREPITVTLLGTALTTITALVVVVGVAVVSYYAVSTVWEIGEWLADSIITASEEAEPEKGTTPSTPNVTYPGDNPTKAPDGYEWRGPDKPGGKRGGYANPNGKDSWHPDLNHPDGIDPHWDYNDGYGHRWRVFPDRIETVPN